MYAYVFIYLVSKSQSPDFLLGNLFKNIRFYTINKYFVIHRIASHPSKC